MFNIDYFLSLFLVVITMCIFITPSIVISSLLPLTHLFKNSGIKLYLYWIISVSFSSIVGYVFVNFYFSMVVKVLYFLFTCFAIYLLIRNKTKIKDVIETKDLLVLIMSIIIILFYLLLNSGPYPRGWDRANHYIMFKQFLLNGPGSTEIGSLIKSYYPRGFYSAIAVFANIIGIDADISFKIFCAISFGMIPCSIFNFSYKLFKNENIALFSSLSAFLTSYIFLPKGNIPFLISFFYLSHLLLLTYNIYIHDYELNTYFYYVLFMFGILIMHPSVLIYYFIIFASYVINIIISGNVDKHNKLLNMIKINIFTIIFVIALLIIIQPNLFIGYLEFMNMHEIKSVILDSIIFRITVKELFILLITPYLILPIIIGFNVLLRARNTSNSFFFSLMSVSVIAIFTNVMQPSKAREMYYLLLPLHSIVGIGLQQIHIDLKKEWRFINVKKLITIIFILFALSNLYYSSMKKYRYQTIYLSKNDVKFASFLEEQMQNQRIAAINSPSMLLQEVMTSNKIIVGDPRYGDRETFIDIYQLFSNSNSSHFFKILQKYDISALILDTNKYPTSFIIEILGKLHIFKNPIIRGDYGNDSKFNTKNISIEVFFKPYSKEESIISKGVSRGPNRLKDWDLFGAGGKLNFIMVNETDSLYKLSTTYPSLNGWHHVVVVLNVTSKYNTAKMYLDGVLVDQKISISNNGSNRYNVFVGGVGNYVFDGELKIVNIYNRSLTENDLIHNMMNLDNPVSEGLILSLPKREALIEYDTLSYLNYLIIKLKGGN